MSAWCRHSMRPSVRLYILAYCTPQLSLIPVTLTFELKTITPVTSVVGDVHTNFGFLRLFVFELGTRTGRTEMRFLALLDKYG